MARFPRLGSYISILRGNRGETWSEGKKNRTTSSFHLVKLARGPHMSFGPPKGSRGGKCPAISGKSRFVKYYSIWPDSILCLSQCLVSRNVDVLKLSKGETLNEELRVTSLSASINRWPWWDVVSLKSFKDLFQSIFEFRFSNPSQSPTPAFSSVFFCTNKSTWHPQKVNLAWTNKSLWRFDDFCSALLIA